MRSFDTFIWTILIILLYLDKLPVYVLTAQLKFVKLQ